MPGALLLNRVLLIFVFTDDTWEEISPGKSRNTMKLEHLRFNLNTFIHIFTFSPSDLALTARSVAELQLPFTFIFKNIASSSLQT